MAPTILSGAAARFPSLAEDGVAQAQSTVDDLRNAGTQHLQAQAGGYGSVAARNDPLRYGSVFSRQYPGAFDAFQDSERPDSSAGLARRTPAAPEISPIDRYAETMRFANQSNSTNQVATTGFGGHTPGRLNRRGMVNGVPTFDDY